jgi:uncharacterized protein (DUF433 family)
MSAQTLYQHIRKNRGTAAGKARVAGRRITVQNIAIWHERMGLSPDEIASEYDLSLAEVHAALAYYFDHRESIDRSISQSADFVAELRKKYPSRIKPKLNAARR